MKHPCVSYPVPWPRSLVLQCELYPKLSAITVLGLLTRMKVQPLSLALSRCAAQGPCALSPRPETSPGGAMLGFIEQVHPTSAFYSTPSFLLPWLLGYWAQY